MVSRRVRHPLSLALLAASAAASACNGWCAVDRVAPVATAPPAAAPAASESDAPQRPKIVCLGDSLTAGYGILESQSFPALLQQRLDEEGYELDVVNAGVSGDTTAGALRRLDWALDGDVRILVVALGGNDALRGLSIDEMTQNLSSIVERAHSRQIPVLLAGMEAPPNYGPEYTIKFRNAFLEIAHRYRLAFVPFLLQGVAGDPALNQADGIHPNPQGARIVADTVWNALKPMVDDAVAR